MSNQPQAHVADERAAFEAALAKECIKPLDDAEIEAAWCGGLGGLWRTARAAIPAGANVASALQHAKLAEQLIVDYTKNGNAMCGYLDDACSHAGIAAQKLKSVIAAGAPAETPKRLFCKVCEMDVSRNCGAQGCGNPWEGKAAAQPAPAPATDARDALDAARWRALLASDRIRMLGSAGLNTPMPGNYAHFGMEIWTRFGADTEKQQKLIDDGNELGRKWLTKYADIAIEAQTAAMLSANSPREAG